MSRIEKTAGLRCDSSMRPPSASTRSLPGPADAGGAVAGDVPLEDVRCDVLSHALTLVGDVDEDRVTAVGPRTLTEVVPDP